MWLIKQFKEEKPSRGTMNTIRNEKADTGKTLMYTVLPVAEKQVTSKEYSFFFFPPKAHSCPCPWHTAILQDKNQQEHKPNLLPFTHQVHKPLFNSQHNEVRYQPLMYNKALEVMQNQKISPQKKLVVWNGVQSFYFGIRMAPAVKRDPCKKSSCSQSNCYARVHSRSEKVFVSALVLTAGAPCFPSTMLHAFEMQKCFCIF